MADRGLGVSRQSPSWTGLENTVSDAGGCHLLTVKVRKQLKVFLRDVFI
jgi:hypothetical protein